MNTLLFVDDDQDIVIALVRQAEAHGYRALAAHNTLTALHLVEQESPDLVCMDVNMPSGNGLGVGELLVDMGRGDLPMIVLTGQSDQDTIRRCERLGAAHVTKGSGVSAWSSIEPLIANMLRSTVDTTPPAATPVTRQESPETPSLADTKLVGDPKLAASGRQGPVTNPGGTKPAVKPASRDGAQEPQEPARHDLIEAVFELLGANADFLTDNTDNSAATSAAADASHHPAPELIADDDNTEWNESQRWVLCIEDDRDFSLALKLKLKARGISVVRANEGMQGLSQASTRPADAIILDFNLPNGQGDFVLRRLKSNPITSSIPVIVLTGVRDQNLEHHMMNLGAAKFMNKPVAWDELFAELDRHLAWPAT